MTSCYTSEFVSECNNYLEIDLRLKWHLNIYISNVLNLFLVVCIAINHADFFANEVIYYHVKLQENQERLVKILHQSLLLLVSVTLS